MHPLFCAQNLGVLGMSGQQNKLTNNSSFLALVSILLTVNIWVYSSAAATTNDVKNTVTTLANEFSEVKGDMQLIKYRVDMVQDTLDKRDNNNVANDKVAR